MDQTDRALGGSFQKQSHLYLITLVFSLEKTKALEKQQRWTANCTRLDSTGGEILSLYPFSFTSWMRSMSMCVWDRFCGDNRVILKVLFRYDTRSTKCDWILFRKPVNHQIGHMHWFDFTIHQMKRPNNNFVDKKMQQQKKLWSFKDMKLYPHLACGKSMWSIKIPLWNVISILVWFRKLVVSSLFWKRLSNLSMICEFEMWRRSLVKR